MRDPILGKLVYDFLSISGKIPGDHSDLAVTHTLFLHQLLDLVNDLVYLSRRIGGLPERNAPCLQSLWIFFLLDSSVPFLLHSGSFFSFVLPETICLISVFCPIAEQMLLQPGKLRAFCKAPAFLVCQ